MLFCCFYCWPTLLIFFLFFFTEIRHGEKYPKNCMRLCPSSKFRSKASVKQLPSSLLSTVSPPYNSKVNASPSKEKNHAMPVVKVERMPEKVPVKKPSSSNNSSSSSSSNNNNNTNNNNNNNNNTNPTNTNQGSAKSSITNGTLKDAGPSASPITAQAVASTATTTPSSDGPAPNSMPGTMAFPNCCNKIACHKPQKKEKLLPCKGEQKQKHTQKSSQKKKKMFRRWWGLCQYSVLFSVSKLITFSDYPSCYCKLFDEKKI